MSSTIAFRANDFGGFRRALLDPLAGEAALRGWHPAPGDLALQLLEWWAYLGDILTFYNERIANESYLRTARAPASVAALVALVGYRPRPAIGAVGQVAAIRTTERPHEPLVVPDGLALASTATPGVPVQTFEAAAASFVGDSDVPLALAPSSTSLLDPSGASVLLSGPLTNLKTGDVLLVIPRLPWSLSTVNAAVVTVASSAVESEPAGAGNTRVTLDGIPPGLLGAQASDYRLVRSTQAAPLWSQSTDAAMVPVSATSLKVHLTAAVRAVIPGDVVFIDGGEGLSTVGVVTGVTEELRTVPYPGSSTGNAPPPPIPIAHTALTLTVPPGTDFPAPPDGVAVVPVAGGGSFSAGEQFWVITAVTATGESLPSSEVSATITSAAGSARLTWKRVPGASAYRIYRAGAGGGESAGSAFVATTPATQFLDTGAPTSSGAPPSPAGVVVRFGFGDVGEPVATPATALDSLPTTATVDGDLGPRFASGSVPAVVADSAGIGVPVLATATGDGRLILEATPATPLAFSLSAPLRLLVDLVSVSRGTTAAAELLGTGDAGVAGQTFALRQAPLTYFTQGAGYASALRVAVDGVFWTEVTTFFGQGPDAKVFVVSQLADGSSQVRFGDGVNGARLPSGSDVVASYRYGAGAASPPAGRLTTILRPQPNLGAILNPVAVSGGADAESPASIRQNGPASVLTFGRAISANDYETVAVRAPGVTRARAYSSFNAEQQRSQITVYVGDDAGARTTAVAALAGAEDPNRPAAVVLATAIPLTVRATVLLVADHEPPAVLAAAVQALADPEDGLFSAVSMAIGHRLHKSQIESALLVDGAVAVHGLAVTAGDVDIFAGPGAGEAGFADPGQGAYYTLAGPPQLAFEVAHA
jgi:hypothetical protein